MSRSAADQRLRWHTFPDADRLARTAASALIETVAIARAAPRGCHVVLAGGSTPRSLYQYLHETDAGDAGWHVWFGDERCLPAGDPERNETLARAVWLDASRIPAAQVHPVAPDVGPEEAARRYNAELAGVGDFDVVLLGLGEDGHTASLFPGQRAGLAPGAPDVIPVRDAPKSPAARVSLSARRLSAARRVMVLVSGTAKRDAVRRWRAGEDLPIAHIRPTAGVDVYLDEAVLDR